MRTYCFISALMVAVLFPLSTNANTFCVSDASQLQTALTTAASNVQDDTIQIVQGNYVGSFIYASTEAYDLAVEGGYTESCTSRVVDPDNTVLDANNSGVVLALSSPNVSKDFVVNGLTVRNGMTSANGGGIYANSLGNIIISNNAITGNISEHGGGAYISSGTIAFINNTIADNSANYGGGVHITSDTSFPISFTNNTITGNTADHYGGGTYIETATSGPISFTNNTITRNTGYYNGGGAYISTSSHGTITLTNNTIIGNTTNTNGGGVYVRITDNIGTAVVTNNIVWNNIASGSGNDLYLNNDVNDDYFPSPVTLLNNDFDQSAVGTYIQLPFTIDPSNLNNLNPLFVDVSNDDYHLRDTSPCIDAGRLEGAPSDDIDGDARPSGNGIDIGADEYGYIQMCKGNFDFDRDVDSTDAALFKKHFGRSLMKNPCPSDGPAPVEKSGQTTSYENYDDGYYQRGVDPLPKPRFSDNGNGTVTDNLTGLIWTKNANPTGASGGGIIWLDAMNYVNGMNIGAYENYGYTDWRVPNIRELHSLIDYGNSFLALPSGHPFLNVSDQSYWSSSTCHDDSNYVWCVETDYGMVFRNTKTDTDFLWPVRGGH